MDLFLFVGRLPLMARRTVDMSGKFLIHFQHITLSQGGLDHVAQELSDIRTAAPPDCFGLSRRSPSSGTQSHHSVPTGSSRKYGMPPQSMRSRSSRISRLSGISRRFHRGRSALFVTKRAFMLSVIRIVTSTNSLGEGQAGRSQRRCSQTLP